MKSILTIAALAAFAGTANADLIISEVVDGDLAGGNPKFVEITNTGTMSFTFAAGDGIGRNTTTNVQHDLGGFSIAPGDSFVLAFSANNGQAAFVTAYGFEADTYSAGFDIGNGDDTYGLIIGGNLVDIFGEAGVDGTGEGWEYTDSFAFRNPASIASNGGAFVEGDWTYGGVAALDASDDATRIALLQANTTPGTHNFIPTPGAAGLLGLAGLVATRRRRA